MFTIFPIPVFSFRWITCLRNLEKIICLWKFEKWINCPWKLGKDIICQKMYMEISPFHFRCGWSDSFNQSYHYQSFSAGWEKEYDHFLQFLCAHDHRLLRDLQAQSKVRVREILREHLWERRSSRRSERHHGQCGQSRGSKLSKTSFPSIALYPPFTLSTHKC